MNTYIILFLGIGLSYCVSNAQSQSNDESKIANGVQSLYKAMVSKDRPALKNLTAEDLTYGHSSGTIENKAEYIEAVMTGPFEFLSIEPIDQHIQITGDTAIVRHIFKAKGVNDGIDTDVRIGVMMAWQQQEGDWLLLARQAYKL